MVGEKITFNASSSYDPDGKIVKYEWDFGDGSKAEGKVTTHSYNRPGDYTVTLTVTDDGGAENSTSRIVTVSKEHETHTVYIENFDAYTVGTFPLGWGKIYSGRGWEYCEVDNSRAFSEPNSLRMEGLMYWSQVIGRQIPNPPNLQQIYDYSNGLSEEQYQRTVSWLKQHPNIWVRAKIMTAEAKYCNEPIGRVAFYKVLPRWGKWYGGVHFFCSSEKGYVIRAGGKEIPYEPYRWYDVLVYANLTSRKATVWVNGEVLAEDFSIETEGWPEVVALVSDHAETKVWFDDIEFGYGPPPTPMPILKPTKPVIHLSYKNTINLGESTEIKVEIYSDSKPITANIKLKINDNVVADVNAHEYTYTFIPDKIGEYIIEVSAEYRGIKSEEIGKITVVGKVFNFVQLAHDMEELAYDEIYQATYLSSSRSVDFAYSEGVSRATDKIMEVFSPVVSFAGELVSEAYRENLGDLADNLGYLYEEVLSEALSEDVENVISAGFSSVKDYATNLTQRKLIEPFADVDSNKEKIHSNTTLLENYIYQNPEKFNDPSNVRKLFWTYSEPIIWVVEERPLGTVQAPIIGEISLWSFQDQVEFYDTVKFLKTIVTIVSIVIAVIIVVATLIVAAKATAVSFGSLLPLIAAKVWGILKIAGTISKGAKVILALAVIMLILSTPTVVKMVNEEHGNSVDLLIEALEGMPSYTASVKASDVKVMQSTYISSAGHTIIVTPDGKIVKIMRGSGYYTPKSVGKYGVLSYIHTPKKLFYSIKSTTFNVTEPNVTMNTSYSISGLEATVLVNVCNLEETPLENLTLIIAAKNSSDCLVFADGRSFNLDKNSCKNLSFTIPFNESDLYTVTSTLSIMAIYKLKEDKFFINVGNVSKDDLIIKAVDAKDVYSPTENVTFNVTVLTKTAIEFDISIPEFNYSKHVFANGTASIPIELPKLKPGEYGLFIQAIRDGRVLDSEIVEFTVEAIDVAILAFNTTKVYYPPNEEICLNLTLTNLEGEPVDADVIVQVITPSGEVLNYTATKIGSEYQVRFTPAVNGTFIVRGDAVKEGYVIKGDEMRIIVGNMSKLEMIVNETDEFIFVRAFANSMPTSCNLKLIKGDQVSTYTINGLGILNKTALNITNTSYRLIVDKEFYEPAVYEHLLAPVAYFTYSTSGLTVEFNASLSYDPDGDIVLYTWDFGDGNITSTTEEKINHSYSEAGIYDVTLTVTDDDGVTNSTSKEITVYSVAIFDTGSPENLYPSIAGTHNGTITPNKTIIATKLYTYACEGTGGHTEYARIWNATWEATATWEGYAGEWHIITFDKTVVLLAGETYFYEIRTGSYPQIHHTNALLTANGWINCTEFTDANGRVYHDWIPAIKLF